MMLRKWGIPAAAALAAAAASLYWYAELPDLMAIHFGPSDQPDRYASKAFGAFLAPALILLIPAITSLSAKLEQNESKRDRFVHIKGTIDHVIVLLLVVVHALVLGYNLGYDIAPSRFGPMIVGVVFIVIGNVLPRAPQSALKAFQMKDDKYAKYARAHGRFMVIAGFLLLLTGFLPGMIGMYAMFAILAALVISVLGGAAFYGRR